MPFEEELPGDLLSAKELIYDKCGFTFSHFKMETESIKYSACTFKLNGASVQFRTSKITPAKTGRFVTIWKRNKDGQTAPFDVSDKIDLLIISSRSGTKLGQFIFPKSILATQKIITAAGKIGKRGIRVYPPWDQALNKQAQKTQDWQVKYFVEILAEYLEDLSKVKELLSHL